jgi:fructose-1,6-bisphosphatase II
MDKLITVDAVAATEAGAIAAARFMGRDDRDGADHAAVEAMRRAMEEADISGTIVIGEGERDEAPMLYIGERVGNPEAATHVDIAVDPLEGTNLVATGSPNATSVLAAAEPGGLMHAPDTYLRKLIVGPAAAGKVSINDPVKVTLHTIAETLGRDVTDITVVILERSRHDELIAEVRATGARIKLIGDGDLTAGINVAVSGTGVHAVMGIGGAPEGVLAAAALKCLGGEIQGTFAWRSDEERERARRMGVDVDDTSRVYFTNDLAPGENVVFCATGVTDGELLRGVRFFGGGARTHSLVMSYKRGHVRFLDTVHMWDYRNPPKVRL